jgi:WD40 repeat protein
MKTADRATNERLLQAYVMGRQHGTKAAHDEWNGERVKHSNLNQITPYTPQLRLEVGCAAVHCMFTSDGSHLCVAATGAPEVNSRGKVHIISIKDPTDRHMLLSAAMVYAFDISKDGKIAVVGTSGVLEMWYMSTLQVYEYARGAQPMAVGRNTFISFAPDGDHIFTGGATVEGGSKPTVWSIPAHRKVREFPSERSRSGKYSGDGKWLAYGARTDEGKAYLHVVDASTYAEEAVIDLTSDPSGIKQITHVEFDTGSDKLAACCGDYVFVFKFNNEQEQARYTARCAQGLLSPFLATFLKFTPTTHCLFPLATTHISLLS